MVIVSIAVGGGGIRESTSKHTFRVVTIGRDQNTPTSNIKPNGYIYIPINNSKFQKLGAYLNNSMILYCFMKPSEHLKGARNSDYKGHVDPSISKQWNIMK